MKPQRQSENIGNKTFVAHQKQIVSYFLRGDVSRMTEREKTVLRLRYGLGEQGPRTLGEIGREFNVTRERVRQILTKALKRVKGHTRREEDS